MTTYNTGTARTITGQAVVTGTNTAWMLNSVAGGMFTMGGTAIPIKSVESETSLTLEYVWPGAGRSGVYSISLANAMSATAVQVFKGLQENIAALRNLSPLARALTSAETQEAMRRLLGVSTGRFQIDESGPFSERAQYDNREAGFAFLASDQALLYIRETTPGSWSDGVPFGKGDDGRQVVLRVAEGAIQWHYDGEAEWRVLLPVGQLTGADGRSLELNTSATHIQWRLAGDATWIDLLSLASIKGDEATSTAEARESARLAKLSEDKTALDAVQTKADREAVTSSRAVVAEDRRLVRVDMEQVTLLRTQVGLDREAIDEDSRQVTIDRNFVAEHVGQTAEDRTVVANIRQSVEGSLALITDARADVSSKYELINVAAAEVSEDTFEANAARIAAEKARDQAEAIVGPTTALGVRYVPLAEADNQGANLQEAVDFLTQNRARLENGLIPQSQLPEIIVDAKSTGFEPFMGVEADTVQAAIFEVFNESVRTQDFATLETEVDGKANLDHTHNFEDLTDLPEAFPSTVAQVQGLQDLINLLAPKADAALTGASTAEAPSGTDISSRIITSSWARNLLTNAAARNVTMRAPNRPAGDNGADVANTKFVFDGLALKADLINGKIPESQLPAVAITDTFIVASQTEMLGLAAERGDLAVRTDVNRNFILQSEPASTLANWVELRAPEGGVTSVAGRTGAITLGLGDVTGLTDALGGKASLGGAAFTGHVDFAASTANAASITIPHGVDPTTLTNGDIWTTTSGLRARISGVTRTVWDQGNLALMSQTEAEAGTVTFSRVVSAQRISQAIAAQTYIKSAMDAKLDAKADLVDGKVPPSQLPSGSSVTSQDVQNLIDASRVGDIVMLPASQVPSGRRILKLNGASISRTAYPALWAYAQASGNLAESQEAKTPAQFGPGADSSTFTLPDYRGFFVRAWDDGKGLDANRTFGSVQASQNLAHNHTASTDTAGSHSHTGTAASAGAHVHSGYTDTTGSHNHTGSAASAGAHTHNTQSVAMAAGGSGPGHTGGGTFFQEMRFFPNTTGFVLSSGAHTHNLSISSAGNHWHNLTIDSGGAHTHNVTTVAAGAHAHTVTVVSDGGSEARPTNINALFGIYF